MVWVVQVLTDSLAMEWTPAQAAWLKRTEGVETVIDAVRRTQAAQVLLSSFDLSSHCIMNAMDIFISTAKSSRETEITAVLRCSVFSEGHIMGQSLLEILPEILLEILS